MKGEIDSAQDALQTLEGMDSQLHKSKKLYQQSCDQVNKLHGKLKKARADPAAPKAKQQVGGEAEREGGREGGGREGGGRKEEGRGRGRGGGEGGREGEREGGSKQASK